MLAVQGKLRHERANSAVLTRGARSSGRATHDLAHCVRTVALAVWAAALSGRGPHLRVALCRWTASPPTVSTTAKSPCGVDRGNIYVAHRGGRGKGRGTSVFMPFPDYATRDRPIDF